MQWFRLAACATALVTLAAVPAAAQGFITPYIGFNYGGDSGDYCVSLRNCEDKRTNWGVSIGKTGGVVGIEEDFGYAKNFFGKAPGVDNAVLTLMSNILVVIPAGPIQPYGLIGLGLIRSHAKLDTSAFNLSKNALGYDIGAGINIFPVHSVGVRGDIRHMQSLSDITLGVFSSDKVGFWRGSLGLTFRF
jgi:opacity protein-like surface antigen